MSFEWKEYLVLANSLHDKCDTFAHREACLRAAVSRGYYAAFCTARNLARDNDHLSLDNTGRDHRTVKRFYENDSDRQRKKVGIKLGRLRDSRNKADYDDAVPQSESNTRAALTASHEIISLLQAIYMIS